MSDWLRSVGVLVAAFVGVAAVTLGLAGIVAPGEATSVAGPDGGGPAGSQVVAGDPAADGGIPGLGGELAVTGDREGTFALTSETVAERYSLEGSAGRIVFEGEPAAPVQISYDGLEFFPDDGQCRMTSGNLDNAIGIGFAELVCTDLVDIRDGGTISLSGSLGLPLDKLVERQLPRAGGSLAVGDETWTFDEATLATWQQPAIAGVSEYNLVLADGTREAVIGFAYDIETHRLSLANVRVGEEALDAAPDACRFEREELGRHNPRTTVIELTIDCPAVAVPGLGSVPISGTVVVDELAWPE